MNKHTDIFVIGTGPSGMAAARTAKMNRPDLSVTAVRREPSYVPCALPYALGGVIKVGSYVKDERKLMTGIGIDLLEGEVARIAPVKKEVLLADGSVYSYDKLIAATGAEPLVPPIRGIGAANIFTIRTPVDVHRILDCMTRDMRVVVIGAGYIGVEVACMMRKAGYTTTIVELLERVMPMTLDAEFSQLAQERLTAHGVDTRVGVGLKELVAGDGGAVRQALLSNDASLPADLVILALGVKPRLRLFRAASIRTERDGVIVDDHMRTNAPDVYACGDCVHFTSFVTGRPVPGKLATNGIFQGKTAAINAIGGDRAFAGFVNACVTDVFGLRLGSAGILEEEAASAGMLTFSGTGVSRNAYPMFEHSREVKVKLLFETSTRRLLGGQVAGVEGIAERIDLISMAVRHRLTADEVARLNHCAHPVQTGVPAHNPVVMAAEDALKRM